MPGQTLESAARCGPPTSSPGFARKAAYAGFDKLALRWGTAEKTSPTDAQQSSAGPYGVGGNPRRPSAALSDPIDPRRTRIGDL